MDINYEIKNFIRTNQASGALLLTGKWGCGKTYLLKNLAQDLNSKDKHLVVVISLFGINSIDTLHRRIKESVLFAKGFSGGEDSAKKVLSKIKRFTAPALNIAAEHSQTIKGINAALTIDWLDFFDIGPEIECRYKGRIAKKRLVLVFDDFERTKIGILDLMGAINDYSENKGIKTIIVADENHIDKEVLPKYREFKEKTISRTIKLTSKYNEAIRSIVTEYNETAKGYCLFLKRNIDLIKELFGDSKTENLRTLKTLFLDFERVFSAWDKSGISKDFMPNVFYNFSAMFYTVKSGSYTDDEYGNLFADDGIRKVFRKWEGRYNLSSVRNWILNASWSEEEFLHEITQKYGSACMCDEQKFLLYDFWGLNQSLIDNGMPVVVEKAYSGDLSRVQIYSLLVKVNAMRKHNIPFPCSVDYSKIRLGFEQRKKKIISGMVEEPKLDSISSKHQTEIDAHQLCDEMEQFEKRLITLANKKNIVDYLKQKTMLSGYSLNGLVIGSFDKQTLEQFLCFFMQVSNAQKREVVRVILNLDYYDANYINEEEQQETLGNFEELKKRLNNYRKLQSDCMTIAIINETIKELDDLIVKIKKLLPPTVT